MTEAYLRAAERGLSAAGFVGARAQSATRDGMTLATVEGLCPCGNQVRFAIQLPFLRAPDPAAIEAQVRDNALRHTAGEIA